MKLNFQQRLKICINDIHQVSEKPLFLRKCPSNCFIVNMIAMKHLNFMKMFGKYNEILEMALNRSLNCEA